MKTLIAGAMLLALSVPIPAHDLTSPLPSADCVPYNQALARIKDAGGRVLGETASPFTRNGTTLYLISGKHLLSAGVAGGHGCIYLPAAVVGNLAFDPAEL